MKKTVKEILKECWGFTREFVLEPALFFGPVILAALLNSFYWMFLLVITLPILFNVTDIGEE